ncbi:hypothetical protein C8R47DRAFT_1074577 [Mycena vitilis]|nr:hypothetical protein C8R47DRAFT_1074577 [Mycena vitilis]
MTWFIVRPGQPRLSSLEPPRPNLERTGVTGHRLFGGPGVTGHSSAKGETPNFKWRAGENPILSFQQQDVRRLRAVHLYLFSRERVATRMKELLLDVALRFGKIQSPSFAKEVARLTCVRVVGNEALADWGGERAVTVLEVHVGDDQIPQARCDSSFRYSKSPSTKQNHIRFFISPGAYPRARLWSNICQTPVFLYMRYRRTA